MLTVVNFSPFPNENPSNEELYYVLVSSSSWCGKTRHSLILMHSVNYVNGESSMIKLIFSIQNELPNEVIEIKDLGVLAEFNLQFNSCYEQIIRNASIVLSLMLFR